MIPTKTYREQNQYIMQIMRLIYIGESKKARKHLVSINMQYVPTLDHMISLGSYNQNIKEKAQDLQEQVDKLTKELKIAKRDEEEIKSKTRIKMGQISSDSSKIRIFNLLEYDDFKEIQEIIKDQKFTKFGKIFQQSWEYRWILDKYDQLMNMKNKSSINKFKELNFQKDRKWIQSLLLGTSTTIVDINKELTKILQAFDTNGKVIIDTQKTLINSFNKNLFLRIHQNQQMVKSQLMKKCQDLDYIENRIKQVYRRFGKIIASTDYTCAEMVYNLATDYEQLKYDLEQENSYSKLDRRKSTEEKMGLIQFKYWFDWFVDIIKINNLANVKLSQHLCEKELYREKFQCIRQLIFQAIQSKKEGISVREKQITDSLSKAKSQLQNFNQKIIMSLSQTDTVGSLLELSKKNYLEESVGILGKNINAVLNELKFYKEQYKSLSSLKDKSITDKWQQELQQQFNLKSYKSERQQIEIETKLKKEISQLKKYHEETEEQLRKKIAENESLIAELKKKIDDLNQEIQTEMNKRKQKENHEGKLQTKIKTLQKSIFQSQILAADADLNDEQSDLKSKLENLILQNQALKVQIAEKGKSIVGLQNLNKAKLKRTQEKYELKIEELRKKCKQYQADLIQSYESIRIINETNTQLMQQKSQNLQESRKSYYEDYKKQYQTQIQKNGQLQKQIDSLKQQTSHIKNIEVVQQGTSISQILENPHLKYESPQNPKIQVQRRNSLRKVKQQQQSKQLGFIMKDIPFKPSQNVVEQSSEFLNYKIKGLEQAIKQMQQQKQNIFSQHQEHMKGKDKQLDFNKKRLEQLEMDFKQLNKKCMQLQVENENEKTQNVNQLHLFTPCPGSIFLQSDYHDRLFLIEKLTHYLGEIKYTQLLYKTDPYNKINFHKYIDKHRHLIVIAKTIYGKMFAGYTQQAFDSTGIKKGMGLIFSLWGRKVFEMREKRAITYDDYYLIFGNSEIRLKSLEMKVFSNFGISNSYYESRGQKVGALLGQGPQRQVDLSHYEVYTLGVEDL